VIDEPKTSSYGGIVAAPAFSEIALQSLCYLKIAPSKTDKMKTKKPVEVNSPQKAQAAVIADEAVIDEGTGGSMMPNFQGLSMRQVLKIMGKSDLNVKLIGSGRAVEQNPPPGHRIMPSDQVWVRFLPSA
jgi:cell division protein FtsI (penicillin-binding protein 3)